MYEERTYRNTVTTDNLVRFTVIEDESDLMILTDYDLETQTREILLKYRQEIKNYAGVNPEFITTLVPIEVKQEATEIIKHMHQASKLANVGPMATVAGAISEYIGRELLHSCNEVIIENGGDIFIKTDQIRYIRIYAGDSPFSNKLVLIIHPEQTPMGICTSAGTVGHSLSFGNADAVVVLSKDTLLADAAATAIGNIVKKSEDIQTGIDYAKSFEGITGVLIIVKDQLGVWGEIELSR